MFALSTDLACAWPSWAARTEPWRAALGPWLMGHASDAALAVATAAFVAEAQAPSSRRARVAWHAAAAGLLVLLEATQGPLGIGTTDVADIAMIVLGYSAVVVASERRAPLPRSGPEGTDERPSRRAG